MSIKPNYTDMALSDPMSPQLRAFVEQQLTEDLRHYGIEGLVKYDWSQSCMEGRDGEYIGSHLDNYSGITLFDINDNAIAEGWMDFVLEPGFILIFWDLLLSLDSKFANEKRTFGIPPRIWQKIPDDFKPTYEKDRMQNKNTIT